MEEHAKPSTSGPKASSALPVGALALAGRVATEIVAGVVVGGLVGWVLDRWLETTPLLMIVLLFVGAAAGMMNIWRIAAGHGLKIGYFEDNNNDDASAVVKKKEKEK